MARRPNVKCNLYGQGGNSLSYTEAKKLLSTLDEGLTLCPPPDPSPSSPSLSPPQHLSKDFHHPDFLLGSQFLSLIAAVAHNNGHYPSLSLERRLMTREKCWNVVSTISCRTVTLGGLSYNDFHVAMMIDMEVSKGNVGRLIKGANGDV